MTEFCNWLSQTPLSLAIQTHTWVIPTLQSIHIVAIAIVMGSVFMVALRILGVAGSDQTLMATFGRFGPSLLGALLIAAITGAFQLMGEPSRELLSFSFWAKMCLLAAATLTAVVVQSSIKRDENSWEKVKVHRWSVKALAIASVLTWAMIMVLGRLIAYDTIWGAWSKVPKD